MSWRPSLALFSIKLFTTRYMVYTQADQHDPGLDLRTKLHRLVDSGRSGRKTYHDPPDVALEFQCLILAEGLLRND